MKNERVKNNIAEVEMVDLALLKMTSSSTKSEDPTLIEMTHDFNVVLDDIAKSNQGAAKVVRLLYFYNMTKGAVARQMGISLCKVRQLEKFAINRLRNSLACYVN